MIKRLNNRDEMFSVQDIAYSVYKLIEDGDKYHILNMINEAKGMKKTIYNSWFDLLTEELREKGLTVEGRKMTDALCKTSTAINYGIRDYRMKSREVGSFMNNMDDRWFAEQNRPFMVSINLENGTVEMNAPETVFEAILMAFHFVLAFNEKDIEYIISFLKKCSNADEEKIRGYILRMIKYSERAIDYSKIKNIMEEIMK